MIKSQDDHDHGPKRLGQAHPAVKLFILIKAFDLVIVQAITSTGSRRKRREEEFLLERIPTGWNNSKDNTSVDGVEFVPNSRPR
jgi:hypothetical protein